MSDTPPLTGSVGDLGFPSKESLENAIKRDNGLGDSGKIKQRDPWGGDNVTDFGKTKTKLGALKEGFGKFLENLNNNAADMNQQTEADKATSDAAGSAVGGLVGNIAFMVLGGAMIIAGVWMLGGGGALVQDAAKAVGIKNARVTG